MTTNGWLQITLFFSVILALTKPVGLFIEAAMEGKQTFLSPVLRWLEVSIYRLSGVTEHEEQRWTVYAGSVLAFSAVSALLLYGVQRLQGILPLNPMHLTAKAISPDLAFNNAISFTTNTNWQSYVPEITVSYFVQMVGLTMHNFVSAASGLAIAIALVRSSAARTGIPSAPFGWTSHAALFISCFPCPC
jgi:potassium-transporting ATPase potassium-binding subunit